MMKNHPSKQARFVRLLFYRHMTYPFFYLDSLDASKEEIQLDEDSSKHIVQVLRMKKGELLNLTDGKGRVVTAEIIFDHKKHTEVRITESRIIDPLSRNVSIGISLLKNTDRFEWFLEKSTEIGVRHIIPLICRRTEKEKFRHERAKLVCISAMLQSQQAWLPVLREPIALDKILAESSSQKLIAHCSDTGTKNDLSSMKIANDPIILIGPEGDFTQEEIKLVLENGFVPVSLGNSRLRSETAGIVAATLLCIG